MCIDSCADRSVRHHGAAIGVLGIEPATDAALEHLIPRVLDLVSLIALLVDHVLLELEVLSILTGKSVNHALFQRDLLAHGALALLGIDTLHHHVRWLLLIVWITARVHDGARHELRSARQRVTLVVASDSWLGARVLLHLLSMS